MTAMKQRSITQLFFALSAPFLWFVAFSITYGLTSVCGPPELLLETDLFFPIVTGVNVVALTALAAIGIAQFLGRSRDAFLARVGLWLTGLSVIALIWGYASLFFLSACEPSQIG